MSLGPRHAAVLVLVCLVAGCTMKSQDTPALSGPSEYGTSVAITITPDVLTQDGASQSLITVTARDSAGAAYRNLSLRAEIEVAGIRADFGSLSARNMVTGSDGRATVVYTAPSAPQVSVDNGTVVTIAITPVGSDFNNSTVRTASIRLVPPGVVIPPDGLTPNFAYSPSAPTDSQTVLFDGSTSRSGTGNPIARYSWNFGDGDSATGVTASHSFDSAGSYVVTLTITDAVGRSAQKSQSVLVTAGLNPTAAFTASPSAPAVNQAVNFNASGTRAAPGRTIDSYEWDFGDGSTAQGITASHAYRQPNAYTVVLTVTDDSGKKGTATNTVTAGGASPTAAFSTSPTTPSPGQSVNFNASGSSAAVGRTIVSYAWDFGDGSFGSGVNTAHVYALAGTYTILLTVTDDTGQKATATGTVTTASTNPTAAFTSSPTAPNPGQAVSFNASGSTAALGRTIVSYAWDFGDGTTGAGVNVTHVYSLAGSFTVTLTVTDDLGRRGTTTGAVASGGVNPTPAFTSSPTNPAPGTPVTFNASGTTPAAGRTIASYEWDFGDGARDVRTVFTTTHTYASAGNFVVILTVTDDLGRKAIVSHPVTVVVP